MKPFSSHSQAIRHLAAQVVRWAETQDQIRTILVVGSQAREVRPADEWSDLDLMVFARQLEAYMNDDSWLAGLGQVWVSVRQDTGADDPELLVLFEGGHKVDFVFYSTEALEAIAAAGQLPEVYHRGYSILLDKDGAAARLPPAPFHPPARTPPTSAQFSETTDTFLYECVNTARQIRRGNLWVVKLKDESLKAALLAMIEWHALATQGWDHDVWHDGRAMSEWAGGQVWKAVHTTFAGFDAEASWGALFQSMELFRTLGRETAEILNLDYPEVLDGRITRLVREIRAADEG